MILPTEKWAISIVRQRRAIQGRIGFYKSGIKDLQVWRGLTLPYIDIRFIKFLQWRIPQKVKCQMCEEYMFDEQDDDLCMCCHASLCQKKAIDCERCCKAAKALINWVKKGKKQNEN